LQGTHLADVADGVYDVRLSKSTENSLFAEDYQKENFLQRVDNMNTLYVAMTRAALGMHIIAKTPSADCRKAVDEGMLPDFKDFSQILYWYVSGLSLSDVRVEADDERQFFGIGEMVDFNAMRREDRSPVLAFPIKEGSEYPSFPVRGRLRLSEDAADFFKDEDAGVSASNRLRGIVLHDILSQVSNASDLKKAVDYAQMTGNLTADEARTAFGLLTEALKSVEDRGWFADDVQLMYNEASLIDTDGEIYRPDRVTVRGGKVVIVDYKFGEHQRKYEKQVRKYMDIWRRMGYEDVSGFLWYVDALTVVEV
jgi:ATP-dependent exoDNAse (exonuclease V) beta subunit